MTDIVTKAELEHCKPFLVLPECPPVISMNYGTFKKLVCTLEYVMDLLEHQCSCQYVRNICTNRCKWCCEVEETLQKHTGKQAVKEP